MKILHLADLHAEHSWFGWVASRSVEYDLIVIAGDLLNLFSADRLLAQATAVSEWLVALPVPTLVCTGNHDVIVRSAEATDGAKEGGRWLHDLRGKGRILGVDGDVGEYRGLKFAVNGWLSLPEYDSGIDLLVTHAPFAGCACARTPDGCDLGDPELWDSVRHSPPRLVMAGHLHAPANTFCQWDPLTRDSLVLVPGCEPGDAPRHWIIDTARRIAIHSDGERVRLRGV